MAQDGAIIAMVRSQEMFASAGRKINRTPRKGWLDTCHRQTNVMNLGILLLYILDNYRHSPTDQSIPISAVGQGTTPVSAYSPPGSRSPSSLFSHFPGLLCAKTLTTTTMEQSSM